VSARQLIVATGVTDELPAVPGVAEHWGRQVVICPYCDGWELRGRRIGILGTGMKSVSQAQLVRQWSDHIVLFVNDIVTLSETDRIGLHARGITVVEGGVTHIEQLPDRALIVHTPHQRMRATRSSPPRARYPTTACFANSVPAPTRQVPGPSLP